MSLRGPIRGLLGLAILLLLSRNASALMTPRPGWRKVAFKYNFVPFDRTRVAALHEKVTFEIMEEYEAIDVAYVPIDQISLLRDLARPVGFQVVEHDEYDIIQVNAGNIDTRYPLSLPTFGRQPANYAAGEYGLYLVQFHAPPKGEWFTELQSMGAILVHPLIVTGELIGATPEIASQIAQLRYVQWMEPRHPFLKTAHPPLAAGQLVYVSVLLANIPGAEEARARTRLLFVPGSDQSSTYPGTGLYTVGVLTGERLELVLREPTVLGFEEIPGPLPIPTLHALALIALCCLLIYVGLRRL